MRPFVLLTAADCHLCVHGRVVLDELAVEWREVGDTSAEGQAIARTAPPMRPVLLGDDGRVLAYGRLSLKRLRKQLDQSGGAHARA